MARRTSSRFPLGTVPTTSPVEGFFTFVISPLTDSDACPAITNCVIWFYLSLGKKWGEGPRPALALPAGVQPLS